MAKPVLNETFYQYKSQLSEVLKELLQFTFDLGNPELHQLVADLRSNIEEPFLFVVVGEVKSGKSSFINALLGENICKVDPAPCTDMIQQIVYADSQTEFFVNPNLKRIGLPHGILKSIAIVDTPGTNTIIEQHHELTKKFIPNSDLVIVVFPAKNPHTKSAWDLLDFVSAEWRKSVVFVLQQADLARPEELEINIAKVIEYSAKRRIPNPRVFPTSAEWESQGRSGDSGFNAIRAFVRETITGGRHYQLKLQSIGNTADGILRQIASRLEKMKEQLEHDKATAERIRTHLSAGRKRSQHEIASLCDRLVASYDRITTEATLEFREGLSLLVLLRRSISSIFRRRKRKSSVKVWVEELQKQLDQKLQKTLEEMAHDGAQHFLEGIRQLLRSLLDELERHRFEPLRQEELFDRIAERRERIISNVKLKVADLLASDGFIEALEASTSRIGPRAMGGGALAIIGAIVMTVTHVTLVDITGGVLAGIGVLLASGVLIFKRGKVVREFQRRLQDGRSHFEEELQNKLAAELQVIYEDIERNFAPFYEHVAKEETELIPLLERFNQIQLGLGNIRRAIEALGS